MNREWFGLDRLLEVLRGGADEEGATAEDQNQTLGLEGAQVGKCCTSS